MNFSEDDETRVREIVRASMGAVEDLPEHIQPAAFKCTFDHLANPPGAPTAVPPSQGTQPALAANDDGQQDAAARVANRVNADPADVQRVLDFDGDEVDLMPGRSRFASQKSVAIQQVALLVVAGRQASGMDSDWTSQQHVRAAAEQLGAEDPSNFALHLKRLEGVRTRGSGRTGEIRMNSVGYEAAGRLIKELARDA